MFEPDKSEIDRLRKDGCGLVEARNILLKEYLRNKLQKTGVDRETYELLKGIMEYVGIYK